MTGPRDWLDTSRQFLDAGDYTRALQTAEAALVQFPGNRQLLELEALVRRQQQRGMEALERVMRAREFSDRGQTWEALAALREANRLDPRNTVIRTVLINLLLEQAQRTLATDRKSAETLAQEILTLDADHAEALELLRPTARTIEQTAPPPAHPAPDPPSRLLAGTGIAVAVLLLIASLVTYSRHIQKAAPPPAAPAKMAVLVHSSPEGAELKINGASCGVSSCQIDLPPGSYPVEAQLTGYQPTSSNITVAPGKSADFVLTLNALPPRAAIFSDLPDGAVSLDGAPTTHIQDGGAEIANLAPGKHTLFVQGGDSTASIPVEIATGAAPSLAGPIEAVNVRAFVVAGYGGEAHVYAAGTGYRATIDGKPAGGVGPDGVALQGLAPGTHELAIDSQTGQHDEIIFESQPSPTLYVSLGAAVNAGTLTVETDQDQAQIYIDGQKYQRATRRGRLVLTLTPRKYTVSARKDGFAPAPDQTVEIKRGAESKLSFRLQAAKATLIIHHAPAGVEVLVDGNRVGTTAGGDFQISTIDPGSRSVGLRREKFKPMQTTATFTTVKPVELEGALEPVASTGTLRFEITPAGAEPHLRIQREGESQERDVAGPSVTLAEGRYTVTASAPQYLPAAATVTVAAGATVVASLNLRHPDVPKAAPKTVARAAGFGLADWLRLGGWRQEAGMIARSGGNFVLAPVDVEEGQARFTVAVLKGKRVECVAGYRDDRNFFYFQLDDKNLTRYEVVNGAKSTQVKVPHGLDKKEPMSVTVEMNPRQILISVKRGGQWVPVDKWDVFSGRNTGKFGFHVSGSDEIGLSDFHLTAN